MSRSRTRIQTAVLAFILLPAAVGVLAVHASQTCERYVRTYVSKPVRNKVKKATLAAWDKWRAEHPNWKPNPKVQRPKYTMTQEEAVNKLEFACAIPTDPANLDDLLFTPADFEAPPEFVYIPPTEGTQIGFPDEVPPEVAEIPPGATEPIAPYVPPILGSTPTGGTVPLLPVVPPPPPPVGTVPEPPSLLLAALGLMSLGIIARIKGRPANTRQNIP